MSNSVYLENFFAGRNETINDYKYFVPNPINRNWQWHDPEINTLIEKASINLGKLNSFSLLVPDLDLFLQLHLTSEAVYSSRIEGTRTEIDEALLPVEDIDPERRDDWQEVQNYIKAMNYAIKRLETLPLSTRLIKETHAILLTGVRGKHRNPGEFRRSQNWIGGTSPMNAVYVPPLHTYINELMSDLENFIHNDQIFVPDLVKIAIIHYQFETIHPFLDGNGRIGRLLITLYLVYKQILDKPLLALSIFFEKNRMRYYNLLNRVRTENDIISWIKFFLEGIAFSADYTASTLQGMLRLKKDLEAKIRANAGRKAANALRLLEHLFVNPVVKTSDVQQLLAITYNTANELLREFVEMQILAKKQLNRKQRAFVFNRYLELFNQ